MYNGKWNHCSGSGVCGHCNLSVQPSGSRVTAAPSLRCGIPCKQMVSLVGRGKWAAGMAHVRRSHHIKFSSREGPTLFWRINKRPPVGRKQDYLETAEGNMLVSWGLNVFLFDLAAHSNVCMCVCVKRRFFYVKYNKYISFSGTSVKLLVLSYSMNHDPNDYFWCQSDC